MIKINKLEIENVKRVKATRFEPEENGLTVIGGKNGQGKTSVLDAITWALGGDRYRPTHAQRDGSVLPPYIHVVLSNGLVVERKGKNSDLKVIDPNGRKGGQQLLNEFVEELALNLPRFMQASGREKADTLLRIIGVGDRLHELEQQERELYANRHAIGQIADQKKKYAQEIAYYPDAPKEPVSATELILRQQEILARNGENQRKRMRLQQLEDEAADVQRKLDALLARQQAVLADLDIARRSAADLADESTAELEQSIANIEQINRKVRANLDKDKAETDALAYQNRYAELTEQLESVRKARIGLLQNADLPLPGLSVEDGELLYQGKAWDCMSGADQLRVATAIVRRLNPKCGFVLLDKLEQMDLDTLREFGAWLEQEGLQAIATRVSTGGECSIIIEDGYIAGKSAAETASAVPNWKAGEF
ncbi:MAG: AAA family ATPase [bacterium]|nr:AAA family ATPase [bacterium]